MDEINPAQKTKFPKKIIIAITALLVLIAGLAAALILVRQRQEVEKEAAVPTGVVKMFLTPETKSVEVGQEFSVDILLNTQNQIISAMTIQLDYPYSGEKPPISAKAIDINSNLVISDDWNFPIKTITEQGGKGQIRIAGFNKSELGYKTTGEEKVATITFKANSAGSINVSFNATESKVTSKSTTPQDVLLVPSSTGTYTASGETDSPSPTAEQNSSPTPTTTLTPTVQATATASATAAPIPVTGASSTTILGIATGSLLLVISLVLLF